MTKCEKWNESESNRISTVSDSLESRASRIGRRLNVTSPGIMAEFSEFVNVRRRFKINEEEEDEKSEKHTLNTFIWMRVKLCSTLCVSCRVCVCVCADTVCLMMLCWCCAAAGPDEDEEEKLKSSSRINRHSVFWILASIALTYYVDFFSVVLNHSDIHRWL